MELNFAWTIPGLFVVKFIYVSLIHTDNLWTTRVAQLVYSWILTVIILISSAMYFPTMVGIVTTFSLLILLLDLFLMVTGRYVYNGIRWYIFLFDDNLADSKHVGRIYFNTLMCFYITIISISSWFFIEK